MMWFYLTLAVHEPVHFSLLVDFRRYYFILPRTEGYHHRPVRVA